MSIDRAVSLEPIPEKRVEQRYEELAAEHGDTMEDEELKELALREEVFDFLEKHLRVQRRHLEKLVTDQSIDKIFRQNRNDSNKVYLVLATSKIKEWLLSHTSLMQRQDKDVPKEQRIRLGTWTPPQFYKRFRYLDTIAYNMRKNESGIKNRVFPSLWRKDYIIKYKRPGDEKWTTYELTEQERENLPEFELNVSRPKVTEDNLPPPPPRGRSSTMVRNRTSERGRGASSARGRSERVGGRAGEGTRPLPPRKRSRSGVEIESSRVHSRVAAIEKNPPSISITKS